VDLAPDFKELLEEFERAKVEAVIVGGYAVAFHARPRATKDIDLVLQGSPANLARAAAALRRFGAPANVVSAVETMSSTEIVFLGQPPLRVDLLRSIDGVSADELFADAVQATLDGVAVKVVSLDHLIANKIASGRRQDLVDVEVLERAREARARGQGGAP
jgi:predicted nucleotidyltransferase